MNSPSFATVPDGIWNIRFFDGSGAHERTWWSSKTTDKAADPLTVVGGSSTPANQALNTAPSGKVGGRAQTSLAVGAPGIRVSLFAQSNGFYAATTTGSGGLRAAPLLFSSWPATRTLPAMAVPISYHSGGREPDDSQSRVRMTVAYDGSAFHGFAAQPDVTTVAGVLTAAIERVLRVPTLELTCAGRTDAGVHAWGQVVSFDVPVGAFDHKSFDAVRQAVNKLCGPSVVVRSIEVSDDPRFDARFSARRRQYRYTILNRPVPDPFLASTSWHVPAPLELQAMALACDPFIGQHDFSSFCRRPKVAAGVEPVSMTRRVLSARWEDAGDGILYFWIEANAFCHQMVRAVTGTIVEVGLGKKRAGDIRGIIAAADRHAAGDLAPPQGLCLWEVQY